MIPAACVIHFVMFVQVEVAQPLAALRIHFPDLYIGMTFLHHSLFSSILQTSTTTFHCSHAIKWPHLGWGLGMYAILPMLMIRLTKRLFPIDPW